MKNHLKNGKRFQFLALLISVALLYSCGEVPLPGSDPQNYIGEYEWLDFDQNQVLSEFGTVSIVPVPTESGSVQFSVTSNRVGGVSFNTYWTDRFLSYDNTNPNNLEGFEFVRKTGSERMLIPDWCSNHNMQEESVRHITGVKSANLSLIEIFKNDRPNELTLSLNIFWVFGGDENHVHSSSFWLKKRSVDQ